MARNLIVVGGRARDVLEQLGGAREEREVGDDERRGAVRHAGERERSTSLQKFRR